MPKTEDQRPQTGKVAAIILAAGQSTRMGAFKPLLPFGSQTVIESCIQYLRDGGVETVIVVVGQNPRAEKLKAELRDSQITIAVNPDPASEMSASISYGVRNLPAQTHAVLITPVDHPAVASQVVTVLVNEWEKGARLVMPTWKDRGGHPVLVDLSFRDELLSLDSGRGLKGLFDAHPADVRRIPVGSNYIARDMDTWDDYRALHKEVFGVFPPKQPLLAQN
ncbi:MAG: NTP transferase domain-containing protein [Pyrinomonadaceae bacterium]